MVAGEGQHLIGRDDHRLAARIGNTPFGDRKGGLRLDVHPRRRKATDNPALDALRDVPVRPVVQALVANKREKHLEHRHVGVRTAKKGCDRRLVVADPVGVADPLESLQAEVGHIAGQEGNNGAQMRLGAPHRGDRHAPDAAEDQFIDGVRACTHIGDVRGEEAQREITQRIPESGQVAPPQTVSTPRPPA